MRMGPGCVVLFFWDDRWYLVASAPPFHCVVTRGETAWFWAPLRGPDGPTEAESVFGLYGSARGA